jgi:NTE family protein
MNSYGAQWRSQVQIGTTTSVETSFYQPLDTAQTFFVEPSAAVGRSLQDIYSDYNRVAQYFFSDLGGNVDVGANLEPNSQVRVGYWADRRRLSVDTGVSLMPTGEFTDAGLTGSAFYDSRDASSFASHGTAARIEYVDSAGTLGASRTWRTLEAAVRQAMVAGPTTLYLTVAGGTDLGSSITTVAPDRAFSLGGPQSFPGWAPGQVRAGNYWVAKGDVLWHVADILPIASQALYGGFGVEGGSVSDRVDNTVPGGPVYGVSLYVGGRTPVGTLTIGAAKATGAWAGWVTLGTPVGSGSILERPLFR